MCVGLLEGGTMQSYVVGFLFDPNVDCVALIRKERPEWQKGLLNGIGGHVEEGETPLDAMRREFQEETGVFIKDWEHTVVLIGKGWTVYFYRADGNTGELKSTTDEEVWIVDPNYLHVSGCPVMSNLFWLIPLHQMNDLRFPITIYMDVEYGE
jgi:8-oxo-dGTP diphosphatase